ncbi:hypothetical protein DLH72_01480 [Candidatus Gracilibacteria bacterium]|nr:MAG: hypothetical protein DLH72_01480 [Candidatus Gracilibacteria bacterium]
MFERIYSLKIFEGIEKDTIKKIINECEVREYSDGEIIIMEGENSNGEGYIIKSGNVEIIIGGKRVAELGTGDIFGEIALLNEESRTATVRATRDLKVFVLNIDHLMELINNGSNLINKTILSRIEENLIRD